MPTLSEQPVVISRNTPVTIGLLCLIVPTLAGIAYAGIDMRSRFTVLTGEVDHIGSTLDKMNNTLTKQMEELARIRGDRPTRQEMMDLYGRLEARVHELETGK